MLTLEKCNSKIIELMKILKQETALLGKGRIEGLKDIANQKANLLVELEMLTAQLDRRQDYPHVAKQIEKLRRLADENGLILKSVLNGLRSARIRLKSLQLQETQVGAYNSSGAGLQLSEDQVFSEKRV